MTRTFTPADPIWCAGCGHFGARAALERSLGSLGIPPHETLVLAGIGCSGTIQNTMAAYGFHALHGRVLPTATGAALANPALTVIAAGGDGDGYAIGAGHLLHTLRRNPPFTYLLMNNGTYGLTKGQDSPTTAMIDTATSEPQVDGIALGLAVPQSTFVARAYAGWIDGLGGILTAALEHAAARRGFAFVEVLSPCVTYEDRYPDLEARLVDLDGEARHDPSDRATAFRVCTETAAAGRIPVGIVLRTAGEAGPVAVPSPATAEVEPGPNLGLYAEIMNEYRV